MTSIETDADSPFGLANLPYGVYSVAGGQPRCCTRFGDIVVDLAEVLDDEVFTSSSLNPFMTLGYDRWVQTRQRLQDVLTGDVPDSATHPVSQVQLHLPVEVADYVDFYASEHHASNLGRLFRPDNPDPLQPNWKHLPVGYHGRAASIVVSGTDIVRPSGQRKGPDDDGPVFGPSQRLDIEAEMGFIVGTTNPMGSRIDVEQADQHIFGAVVFNDWSARDIQA